ncbi:hypothetical protein D3C85_853780 [compost metagenome]
MEAQAPRYNNTYLYVFANEAVMHRAIRLYDLSNDTATKIWHNTFKVPVFDKEAQDLVDLPAILVRRRSSSPKFPTAKRWDIGAIGIYEVDREDLSYMNQVKFQFDHPLAADHTAASFFAHAMINVPAEPKIHWGGWTDGRSDDRMDRKLIADMICKAEDWEITGDEGDRDIVEELALLFSLEPSMEQMDAILAAHGARLNEIARYLEAVRFPMRRGTVAVMSYMRALGIEDVGYDEAIELLPQGLPPFDAQSRLAQVTIDWALGWVLKHHVDCSYHTIVEHVEQGSLYNLMKALDNPVLFDHEHWRAVKVAKGYVVRDAHSGDWFLLTQRPDTEQERYVERKMHVPNTVYTLSHSVTFKVPSDLDVTRCFDELDANYRLAKFYADQLEGK